MFEKQLPARPDLAQYKKQAKEILRDIAGLDSDRRKVALFRMVRNHPRFRDLSIEEIRAAAETCSLTEVQLVIAREHGFQSWPRFAHHVETVMRIESVAKLVDPVAAFLEVATIPQYTGHATGTVEHAEMILARNQTLANAKGGPLDWDPLTYLCFSRYLRIDKSKAEAFVATARALLEAGARAQSGWYETIDRPTPHKILESTLYGAAGIAQHAGLTQLLLDHGADPNDDELPYHVPETYDNTVVEVLLKSGKLNLKSKGFLLARKADWHDAAGMKLVLEHGGDPNYQLIWDGNAFHHTLRRDNALSTVALLLDYGANPDLRTVQEGFSATAIAARRGRSDVLGLFSERGIPIHLSGVDKLIAACACGDKTEIDRILGAAPTLLRELLADGGRVLSEFAANDNLEGVRCLLDLGVDTNAPHGKGDAYWDVTRETSAIHFAAWRASHSVVAELIERGAQVNAIDGRGRTPLMLAAKACVDSHWTRHRKPDSVAALLRAGASTEGISVPTGYDAIDELFRAATEDSESKRSAP
jgi:ankyrin repeat protein/transposase